MRFTGRLGLNTADRACVALSCEIDVRMIYRINSKSDRVSLAAVFNPTRTHRAIFLEIGVRVNYRLNSKNRFMGPIETRYIRPAVGIAFVGNRRPGD